MNLVLLCKDWVSSLSIVSFDNEVIKNWRLPGAFLHTFVATDKSMATAERSAVSKLAYKLMNCKATTGFTG